MNRPKYREAFVGEYIWIIGASSGIGAALAAALSRQGATLILSARREAALQSLNQQLGGHHLVLPFDVADNRQRERAIASIDRLTRRIDRVIFMAAVYQPMPIRQLDSDFLQRAVQSNTIAAMLLAQQLLPIWTKQATQDPAHPMRGGQLLLCGSVAGLIGLPNGQPYSATKAALMNFAESLYAEEGRVVDVKVINPGFVYTPMTAKNPFPMPFCITPEEAAQAICRGMQCTPFEIHFPKRFTLLLKVLRLLPYRCYFYVARRLMGLK